MKKVLIILSLLLPSLLMAQEKIKQKEIGLVFSSLDRFGLTYRVGNQKTLWRFSTLALLGDQLNKEKDSLYQNVENYGVLLGFGKEYRKALVEKVELRYGMGLFFNYT
ncbi:MAG: hypothetical protein MUE33_10060 [Cytophagaceae bacterium]|jgi:type II secretory pathway pseudopilin PulG|nr:hypothetical protein [Cytophagaceae bacterium]